MATKNKYEEDIIKRLNIMITILLEESSAGANLSMADKISKLNYLGVPQTDIAKILGKPLNYVTASLSQRKTKKKQVKSNG